MHYSAADDSVVSRSLALPATVDAASVSLEEFRSVFKNFLHTFTVDGIHVYLEKIKRLGLHHGPLARASATVAALELNLDVSLSAFLHVARACCERVDGARRARKQLYPALGRHHPQRLLPVPSQIRAGVRGSRQGGVHRATATRD